MSEHDEPFALAELPTRAPWWPLSPWSTGQKIRRGQMAAIRVGRRILVTEALLRRYLTERVAKEQSPYTPLSAEQKAARREKRARSTAQPQP